MNQRLAAHVSGWIAFAALAITLASGYVMMMPWAIRRKITMAWHKAWTVATAAAIVAHIMTQYSITNTTSWVMWGWVSSACLLAAWLNKGPRWVHKWVGLAAYTTGTYHTLVFTHHSGGNAPLWGIAFATAIILWLLGARYTIVAAPRMTLHKTSLGGRWSNEDGSITSATRWGVRAKARRLVMEQRTTVPFPPPTGTTRKP